MNFWRNINVMFAKKFFNVWVKLTSHVKIAHEYQKIHDHKCDTCRKSFSLAWNLKTHINSVHNYQRDHKWDSCAKSFSRGGDLKKHINVVHNGQKDHKCDYCGKMFSQAGHLKTVHIDQSPAFVMFWWCHEKVRKSHENFKISHDIISNYFKNLMRN